MLASLRRHCVRHCREVVALNALAGSQAAYSTSYRVHGVHSLTAIYSGDLHNAAGTSTALTEYIGKFPVPSRTTLNTSGSPSLIGQTVTFTATVAPGDSSFGAIPDGEPVTLYDGTSTLGSVAVSNGSAAYSTPSLSTGNIHQRNLSRRYDIHAEHGDGRAGRGSVSDNEFASFQPESFHPWPEGHLDCDGYHVRFNHADRESAVHVERINDWFGNTQQQRRGDSHQIKSQKAGQEFVAQ